MIKTPLMLASLAALALALPAAAKEQTRTRNFEGPKVTGTGTTIINRETGTRTRERAVTNIETGNTATTSAVRKRTDTGSTVSVVRTGPQGNTRTLEGERVRTDTGSTFTGTATGRGGEILAITGERGRDGQGTSWSRRTATNGAGETVYDRSRTTTRSDGQVSTTVTRSGPRAGRLTGAPGARPPGARRPRG
jgi:hypothetical protein